jgi:hypothetical protein
MPALYAFLIQSVSMPDYYINFSEFQWQEKKSFIQLEGENWFLFNSKTLSISTPVNPLFQNVMFEKGVATLFCQLVIFLPSPGIW